MTPLGCSPSTSAAPATPICRRAPFDPPAATSSIPLAACSAAAAPRGSTSSVAVIGRWGGLAESRVLLRGIRLPAPQAALLNASMGHALDFDDTLDTGGSIHPGVSVLGAVLAVADSLGGVTRARMCLLAVALGLDVSCRIALASTVDRGWHRTAAMGVFGAAAAAGKLIGLTPEQMLAAFGIAYSHAAGNRQCILDGALTKRHAGRPGGERRRFLGGFGADRVHRRAQHLQRPLRVFRAVPAERARYLGAASARPGHGVPRRGAELQALSLRPPAAPGDRRRAGGASSARNRRRPTTSRR